jgi:hypothetical protein
MTSVSRTLAPGSHPAAGLPAGDAIAEKDRAQLDLLRAQEDLFVVGRDLIDTLTDRATARFRLLHLTADLVPVMRQP